MAMKWYRYVQCRTKADADVFARRLRRISSHRKEQGFAVKIVSQKKTTGYPKGSYIVYWRGSSSVL